MFMVTATTMIHSMQMRNQDNVYLNHKSQCCLRCWQKPETKTPKNSMGLCALTLMEYSTTST